jgi:hypothetical protein
MSRAPRHPHIHKLIAFRRFTPYEAISMIFTVIGLVSLYFLLEQTRVASEQTRHVAR